VWGNELDTGNQKGKGGGGGGGIESDRTTRKNRGWGEAGDWEDLVNSRGGGRGSGGTPCCGEENHHDEDGDKMYTTSETGLGGEEERPQGLGRKKRGEDDSVKDSRGTTTPTGNRGESVVRGGRDPGGGVV